MWTIILVLVIILIFSTMYCNGSDPKTFLVEKIGTNMNHHEMLARDQARHHHIFERPSVQQDDGIPKLPLSGSADGYKYSFYFTKVKIGNPPKDYHLIVDTASDLTWVNCKPCIGCPHNSTIVPLSFFDPRSSSSAVSLSCSDRLCSTLPRSNLSSCSSTSPCTYSISYVDGSTAAGYYVSDTFHFDTVMGRTATTSADVVFGCTSNSFGQSDPQTAVDGIFGLGLTYMSLISQLTSQGVMPSVFSHCLNGDANGGGGILVLGEILDPRIIYTPIVPEQTSYHVNLLSISINGQTLPIDPNVFSISGDRQGTIFDSGTTYTYFPEEAYDSFIHAVVAVVPPSVRSSGPQEGCFQISNRSLRDVFPSLSLNFAGGASMILKPEHYLLLNRSSDIPGVWCFDFQKSQGLTILGDLILKNKMIVYDLALQRIGWADYDCSSSANLSLVPPRDSSASRDATLHQFLTGLLYIILMSAGLLFV